MSVTLQELYNEITVAGMFFWADYSGFICQPDHDDEAIPCLSAQLQQMHWRDIYLKNLSISEKHLDLFINQFDSRTFSRRFLEYTGRTDNINRLVCPYVTLPGEFETCLTEKLSTNTRQKIHRFLRKIDNPDELSITHSTPETYARDLDILIDFRKIKQTPSKGSELERIANKYREILQHGLGKSRLALKKFKQAESAIRMAIELSPTATISRRYYLGLLLPGQNMEAEAITEFESVLDLEPHDIWDEKKQNNARKYFRQDINPQGFPAV